MPWTDRLPMRSGRLPKLNIGCGRAPLPKEDGWINCDLYHGEGVDQVFDCQGRWPFPDESVQMVYSSHTLEHLSNPMAFFDEAWRVLVPNGQIQCNLPYGWCNAAWWDPTHLRPYMQENFAFLQPGYKEFVRNLQHNGHVYAFWIRTVLVFQRRWAKLWRWRLLRPWIAFAGNHLVNVFKEIILEGFKTTQDDPASVVYGGQRHPVVVNVAYAVAKHDFEGRDLELGEQGVLIVFGEHQHVNPSYE